MTADEAVAALARGEVIAVATDTVWGLVCRPDDPAAVARVYELKQRPAALELTLLAARPDDLAGLVRLTPAAERLAAHLWPGPLSLVVPVGERRLAVPRQGGTLSVRVPGDPQLRALLERTGPLASTSANRHGEPPATAAGHVEASFGSSVALLEGGVAPGGTASTIIDCSVDPPRVLRPGPIDSRVLQALLQG
ncbi:MAG: L-threonylcarbamoyladenylate synthase [Candidatus Dormibacteria bacterium]